jgi:predicted negative regulator of RcsB-dependent stress response
MGNRKQGFSPVEVVLVIAVVGLLVLAGWSVYQGQKEAADSASPSQPPEVNDSGDLADVEEYLRSFEVEKELDTQAIEETFAESN